MQKETIVFTGMFSHYMPINLEPYYVFTTAKQKFLIKCADYPKFIGKLAHYDLVSIEAEVEEQCREGTKLTNVKWSLLNE